MRALWGESQAIWNQHPVGFLNKQSSQRASSIAKSTASRCLKHLASFLCFSMHCPMIDRQTDLPGLKAVLCCCERIEDAGGGCSSGPGLNPQQQSHLNIKNNPGVSGGGAGMGLTAQTAAAAGPLLACSAEKENQDLPTVSSLCLATAAATACPGSRDGKPVSPMSS